MAGVSANSEEVLALNVMPLLDIFSILILFLLMSFSNEPVSHDVNPALELPDSKTIRSLDEVPEIIVTKNGILVQDKQIATIMNGDVEARYQSQGAIVPLYDALQKMAERNKGALGPKKSKNIPLTIEMDKGHNFKLLKRIMLSAQQAEFVTIKMMVSKQVK
jgi:biopolymer transport protein ExbD